MNTRVKYEDSDILIIHKPAGIATETAKLGQADVVSELKNYRKKNGEEPYIGVIHRLDQPVEGLLVFAKNPEAAKKLSQDLQKGSLKKTYYALVIPKENKESGRLEDYLLKDTKTNLSRVVDSKTPGSKFAALNWKKLKEIDYGDIKANLIEVEIETGRHHQIRVQMSNAGMPLVGDTKYGNEETSKLAQKIRLRQTALFAGKLEFTHPSTNEKIEQKLDLPLLWKIS